MEAGWDREVGMAAEACSCRMGQERKLKARHLLGAAMVTGSQTVPNSLHSQITGRSLCFLLDGGGFLWLFISNLKKITYGHCKKTHKHAQQPQMMKRVMNTANIPNPTILCVYCIHTFVIHFIHYII